MVGTIQGSTKADWIPEIYNSATGSWKLTAPHSYDFGYLGELIERVEVQWYKVLLSKWQNNKRAISKISLLLAQRFYKPKKPIKMFFTTSHQTELTYPRFGLTSIGYMIKENNSEISQFFEKKSIVQV